MYDGATAHDADYRTSLQDFTSFLEKLTERISELDPTVPELPVKDIVRHQERCRAVHFRVVD